MKNTINGRGKPQEKKGEFKDFDSNNGNGGIEESETAKYIEGEGKDINEEKKTSTGL